MPLIGTDTPQWITACWDPSYSLSTPSISSIFQLGQVHCIVFVPASVCLWPSILARRRGSFFNRASRALRSVVYINLTVFDSVPFFAHSKVNSSCPIELCICFSNSTKRKSNGFTHQRWQGVPVGAAVRFRLRLPSRSRPRPRSRYVPQSIYHRHRHQHQPPQQTDRQTDRHALLA